jgi:two-component system cell cycle response regulator DivK
MEQQATERQPTIMIVEDDEDTRRAYSAHLRHSGFVVVEAGTGPEAVERASERSFDLILMDMNLPDLDGWEAARRIKSDPDSSRAPLVAFSATVDSCADLRSGTAPFDGFIAKPVTPSALVRRVHAYVELLSPSNVILPSVR